MTIEKVELHAMGFRAIVDLGSELLGAARLDDVLLSLGASRQRVEDATAWFSLSFAEALMTRLMEETGNPLFVEAAAERMFTPRYLGPIFPLYRSFGTPAFTYTRLLPLAQRTNKTGLFTVERLAPHAVRLTWTNLPETPERAPHMCRLRVRQLQLASTLFGFPEATVVQPKCAQRGDDACVYEVSWKESASRLRSRAGLVSGIAIALVWAWSGGAPIWQTLLWGGLASVTGWAAGRVAELRADLAQRDRELSEHEAALTQVAQANEKRYAELLEAKAEVDQKVELRTRELQTASERLTETLAEIQALDRAKTDFFNNVSHELRSPLTLILAPLDDLAAGRQPPGGQQAAFEAMRRNAARLLHLINQLLDLAKIDAGQMEITPVPTDLPKLVASILTGFEAAAKMKGVRLDAAMPAGMSMVALDVSWIESAITNLIANALKFTSAGGEVRVALGDRGADVYVTVSDDGPGIAPADQEKVFARFAQGDTNRRVVGGTGIGLALVREAARLHGGDVRLASELGKGSTFTLTLPRRPDQHAEGTAHVTPPLRPDANAQSTRQLAVSEEFQEGPTASERRGPSEGAPLALVVEDNPELRNFVADVLAANYRVRTVSDGRQALQVARELKPDVIVSDVAMPEMNGYALCRALREEGETRTIPILLVTARTDVASVLEGFEAGANDYVLKPFHGRELLARVDVHVRLRRMVHQLALQERHAALGVLAASVAHQVRNPLTTLISGLPAMQGRMRDKVDQRTNDLITVMVDCAQRIERVSLDLMDLSRVDREEGGEYRPCEGLRSAVRMLQARAPASVNVEEKIDDCTSINGRAGDMNHVFLNLLDNAIRAVGAQGTVRVEAWNANGTYFVRVGDSGPGISPETAARVFEPFFTTRQAGEGTGLGLAIARQVVQQAGGDIIIERSELGGAAFVVRIPTLRQRVLQSSRPN